MAIQRQDFAQHLEQGVRIGFTIGVQDYTPLREPFTRFQPSDGSHEDYADMGAPPWPIQNAGKQGDGGTVDETGVVKVNIVNAGQNIKIVTAEERGMRIINLDWEMAIGISHNLIDDDRTGQIVEWAQNAGINSEKHKDFLAFDALNSGAANTNYGDAYDDLSFFNDSHVDTGAEYRTVQDNSYSLALSMDNFETVQVAGAKFLDSRGQPAGTSHNLLIVPNDLKRTARQITGSILDPGTANEAINPYAGETRLIVSPGTWLDSTAWFMIDDTLAAKPLNLQVRKDNELVIWDDEEMGDGGVRYYKWHARYSMFYGDWRLALQGRS